ncbi:hypothetical protein H9P43_004258 [Blastocladiella emersonii ATCC 22665]|nr:hypothetical protein H9P43_004258 [Blastocladiella emersonii ATCC 22665]
MPPIPPGFLLNKRGSLTPRPSISLPDATFLQEPVRHLRVRTRLRFAKLKRRVRKYWRRLIEDPTSPARQHWEWLHMILSFVVAFLTPFQIAFRLPSSHPTSIVIYLALLLTFTDIAMALNGAVITADGQITRDRRELRRQYFRSRFLIDLLYITPTYFIFNVFAQLDDSIDLSNGAPPVPWRKQDVWLWLNSNRLVIIIKIVRWFRSTVDLLSVGGLRVRIAYLLFLALITIHVIACLTWSAAIPGAFTADYRTWSWNEGTNLHAIPFVQAYGLSVYRSVNLLFSYRYAQQRTFTEQERTVTSYMRTSGRLIVAYITAKCTAIVTNSISHKIHYRNRVLTILEYATDRKIEDILIKRIERHFQLIWRNSNGLADGSHILEHLPYSARTDIMSQATIHMFRAIPLFQDCEESFFRALSSYIKERFIPPNELIVTKGDWGRELYIIKRGYCEVIDDESGMPVVVGVLGKGSWFGEISVFMACRRTATIRSRSNMILTILHKHDLDLVLPYFPAINRSIQASIYKKLEKDESRRAQRSSYVSNVPPSLATNESPHTHLHPNTVFAPRRSSVTLSDPKSVGGSGAGGAGDRRGSLTVRGLVRRMSATFASGQSLMSEQQEAEGTEFANNLVPDAPLGSTTGTSSPRSGPLLAPNSDARIPMVNLQTASEAMLTQAHDANLETEPPPAVYSPPTQQQQQQHLQSPSPYSPPSAAASALSVPAVDLQAVSEETLHTVREAAVIVTKLVSENNVASSSSGASPSRPIRSAVALGAPPPSSSLTISSSTAAGTSISSGIAAPHAPPHAPSGVATGLKPTLNTPPPRSRGGSSLSLSGSGGGGGTADHGGARRQLNPTWGASQHLAPVDGDGVVRLGTSQPTWLALANAPSSASAALQDQIVTVAQLAVPSSEEQRIASAHQASLEDMQNRELHNAMINTEEQILSSRNASRYASRTSVAARSTLGLAPGGGGSTVGGSRSLLGSRRNLGSRTDLVRDKVVKAAARAASMLRINLTGSGSSEGGPTHSPSTSSDPERGTAAPEHRRSTSGGRGGGGGGRSSTSSSNLSSVSSFRPAVNNNRRTVTPTFTPPVSSRLRERVSSGSSSGSSSGTSRSASMSEEEWRAEISPVALGEPRRVELRQQQSGLTAPPSPGPSAGAARSPLAVPSVRVFASPLGDGSTGAAHYRSGDSHLSANSEADSESTPLVSRDMSGSGGSPIGSPLASPAASRLGPRPMMRRASISDSNLAGFIGAMAAQAQPAPVVWQGPETRVGTTDTRGSVPSTASVSGHGHGHSSSSALPPDPRPGLAPSGAAGEVGGSPRSASSPRIDAPPPGSTAPAGPRGGP